MAQERLAPLSILAVTGLSGAVGAIQDDPDSPDASWLTAPGSNTTTNVRVDFATPAGSLTAGAGLQNFRVLVRKTNHSTNPTAACELWEGGVLVRAGTATAISSTTGVVLALTWDAAELADPSGANAECRVSGTPGGGSPGNRASVEVGAIEWNAEAGAAAPAVGTAAVTLAGAGASGAAKAPARAAGAAALAGAGASGAAKAPARATGAAVLAGAGASGAAKAPARATGAAVLADVSASASGGGAPPPGEITLVSQGTLYQSTDNVTQHETAGHTLTGGADKLVVVLISTYRATAGTVLSFNSVTWGTAGRAFGTGTALTQAVINTGAAGFNRASAIYVLAGATGTGTIQIDSPNDLRAAIIDVIELGGVKDSGAVGAAAEGNTASAGGAFGLTTTASGSWLIAQAAIDASDTGGVTVTDGTTLHIGATGTAAFNDVKDGAGRKLVASPGAATIGFSWAATTNSQWVAVEILAGAAGAGAATGTAAITLAGAGASGAGKAPAQAAASVPLAGAGASGAAKAPGRGIGAVALTGATAAGAGKAPARASAAVTLAGAGASGAAKAPARGTATVLLAGATAAATGGETIPPAIGTAAVLLAGAGASGAAKAPASAAGAATLAGAGASGAAKAPSRATGGAVLAGAGATGAAKAPGRGIGAVSLAGTGASGAGKAPARGAGVVLLSGATASAAGGEGFPPAVATGFVLLAGAGASGQSKAPARATGAVILDGADASGSATVVPLIFHKNPNRTAIARRQGIAFATRPAAAIARR